MVEGIEIKTLSALTSSGSRVRLRCYQRADNGEIEFALESGEILKPVTNHLLEAVESGLRYTLISDEPASSG